MDGTGEERFPNFSIAASFVMAYAMSWPSQDQVFYMQLKINATFLDPTYFQQTMLFHTN